jgi:hypothetical protein
LSLTFTAMYENIKLNKGYTRENKKLKTFGNFSTH